MKESALDNKPAEECLDRAELLSERLFRDDSTVLTDSELLELLLGFLTPGACAETLAGDLMRVFGGLRGALDASAVELAAVDGMGRSEATLLRLVREMALRAADRPRAPVELLSNPKELERYLLSRIGGMREEAVLLLFLTKKGVLLGEELLATGTLNQVVMFPRRVMELALRHNAASVVIAHNHPHGPPLPSIADREEAESLRDALRPFDVDLKDSIVVGPNRCFSIFKNAAL